MPDTPASDEPLIGWHPALDVAAPTLVRPVPWARPFGDLRFEPQRWGRIFRIAAPGGAHLIVRRQGAAELACWLPDALAPCAGDAFGLYLHADRHHGERLQSAGRFRRAIGYGVALPRPRWRDAQRHAAMLWIHDQRAAGASLRDSAERLLPNLPEDWRTSSERSDLRRLAEQSSALVTGGYRSLLNPSRRQP